jgi:2-amino-4-hydroxy-6-hydroxymethyldihydropteridine diphosphokinase
MPAPIAAARFQRIKQRMILIALGANLPSPAGPPAATLRGALGRLKQCGITILSVSSFYQTPAWPDPSQPPYVNAVARVATRLQPAELLALLHDVEDGFGRRRGAANASRTLDLDLLDYDGRIMASEVMLPHPRMAERSFVLAPLAEIAPGWQHPLTRQGAGELLAGLPDRDAPKKLA